MGFESSLSDFDISEDPEIMEEPTKACVMIDGYLCFDDQSIKVCPDGMIKIDKDIKDDKIPMLLSPFEILPLIEAGVLPTEPITELELQMSDQLTHSFFKLAQNGEPGRIYIKKDDLNRAIHFGLLRAVFTKENEEIFVDIQGGNY